LANIANVNGAGGEPLLFLVLECEDLRASAARWSLAVTDLVLLGRGEERRARRDGQSLEITVADPRMSSRHARLIRIGERWIVEDRGSKNGTIVNGRPVLRADLRDGDLLEVGRTLLLFRQIASARAPSPDRDQRAARRVHRALRTLSVPLSRAYERLAKLARSRSPLWIRGEPGTDTERVARAAHELSGSRARPVVVRGDRDRLPRGAKALLVLEAGALPGPDRASLLERIRRGAHVVCTSENTELPGELARSLGRPLGVLPLRERKEDLGSLLAACLKRSDPRYAWAIEPDAARVLFAHGWPENLRELRALSRRLVTTADQGLVRLCDLPAPMRAPPLAPAAGDERQRIDVLLTRHAGNVSAVARALGRDRSSLRRLLGRLVIDPSAYR
jgi:hypothetical protein